MSKEEKIKNYRTESLGASLVFAGMVIFTLLLINGISSKVSNPTNSSQITLGTES